MGDNASVECYSGHTYAQEPRAFVFADQRRIVTRVCRTWREPAGPRFQVLADDETAYLLAYDEDTDQWRVSAVEAKTLPTCLATHNTFNDEEDDQR